MAAKKSPQKIVILAGTLNPDQQNVIQIPIEASRSELIVAKPTKGLQQVAMRQPIQSPGSPQIFSSSPHQKKRSSTQRADPATPAMEELEAREKRNFEEDLKKFQNSRRKLFFHVMSLQMTKLRKVPVIEN